MLSHFRFSCFLIGLIANIYGCTNENSDKFTAKPNPVLPDTTFIKSSQKVDTVSKNSNCNKEKELIKSVLSTMQERVSNARKAYKALRNDEIAWGKYIRNWNIEAKNFREAYNATNFDCIHSFYIGEAWISLLEIGNSYAFDDLPGVREFERKINSGIAQTLRELKNMNSSK
jgi:hypothetical protein